MACSPFWNILCLWLARGIARAATRLGISSVVNAHRALDCDLEASWHTPKQTFKQVEIELAFAFPVQRS
jgi:hypothetical protein